ncbi:murein L,D-transpeptidase catalytic domain family protein [Sphingopyxis sp. KK2]|uniref:murein L,D-transpeptidase catalytic domain family protein n=1 Tax=Sphingopyxis sp. KK2 TaxID=1855727 RepID=UPI0015C3C48B|nr:murein L,D-transpeptidase catalytic domain family protein [Sphingopyxis sp. KK2]
MTTPPLELGRRTLMVSGAAALMGALAGSTVGRLETSPRLAAAPLPLATPARPISPADTTLDPQLLRRALAALDEHAGTIRHRDRIAIVDFSAPSSEARFHFLDVASGRVSRQLVAHGSGSDPGHTGYLHSFSNMSESNASSEGAFLTGDYYVGKHGRSQRLTGLDATNDNAMERAIVIHGAWYANDDMIAAHGKLGRSQGCFAVGEQCLDETFAHLGTGRLIYAARA